MSARLRRVLFLLFFASGFCGLLYQVVWVRMAFASFGVIMPVLSVVLSVFMFGLFAGSWWGGKLVGPLGARTTLSAVWFYAVAELLVGLGAFAVPRLFGAGDSALLSLGESDSFGYLLWSALFIAGAILPWCICMGTTFPFMMAFVKERDRSEEASFSFLYLANVIGAMAGTLVTALVLVELLGFQGTLRVAAVTNFLVAATAAALGLQNPRPAGETRAAAQPAPEGVARPLQKARLLALILFTTGFTSMAMEVAWMRAFTAVLMTEVYSFAGLLFAYLLATWIGSLFYRRHLAQKRVVPTGRLLAWLAFASALPIVLNDPRLGFWIPGVFVGIIPFCALLGYLTPKLIDRYSAGRPEAAGFAYAINVLGCILGPLLASYLLLPTLGVKWTLLLLAAPYAALLALYAKKLANHREVFAAAGVLLVALALNKTYEDQVRGFRGEGLVRRDHTATVISYGKGMKKTLLVNGVGMTYLTTLTKVMAHLPLAVVKTPRSALVICFGMGTTFRSLTTWGLQVTAAELVPGVKDSFGYFFTDATEVLSRHGAHIVVDDGRRFLRRTGETFDVITLDPPPPVEAAASSLLYSEEFYVAAKARLSPGGILQQWVPNTEPRILQAVTRSLLASFPHVRMFRSFESPSPDREAQGFGYHILASMQPIEMPSAEELAARMPPKAQADLLEWTPRFKDAASFLRFVIALEADPLKVVQGGEERITDDRPFNEYYLLRRIVAAMRGDGASTAAPSFRPRRERNAGR